MIPGARAPVGAAALRPRARVGAVLRPRARVGATLRLAAVGAVLLLASCAGGGAPATPSSPQPPTEQTSEFGCVTPAHFCPNAFDIDLRQKACTCQGEPGRFKYRLRGQ